jgi:hypothetical protein
MANGERDAGVGVAIWRLDRDAGFQRRLLSRGPIVASARYLGEPTVSAVVRLSLNRR